jgi:hypothetical protein
MKGGREAFIIRIIGLNFIFIFSDEVNVLTLGGGYRRGPCDEEFVVCSV